MPAPQASAATPTPTPTSPGSGGLPEGWAEDGGGRYRIQPFDYYAVLDFEATCEDGVRLEDPEIIEFPVVLLRSSDMSIVDEFHAYVRPETRPVLSEFCTSLTGIEQSTVNKGKPLAQVMTEFGQWRKEKGLQPLGGGGGGSDGEGVQPASFLFVTCGDWDLKTMLKGQLERLGIDRDPCFDHWCNIKQVFTYHYGVKGRGMDQMLSHMSLTLHGRHHSGIDDARNIAQVVRKLAREGALIQSTYRPPGPKAGDDAPHAPTNFRTTPPTPSGGPSHVWEQNSLPSPIANMPPEKVILAQAKARRKEEEAKNNPPPPSQGDAGKEPGNVGGKRNKKDRLQGGGRGQGRTGGGRGAAPSAGGGGGSSGGGGQGRSGTQGGQKVKGKQVSVTPSPHAIVDIGINLTHRSFAKDLEGVLARSTDSNLGAMVLTGTSLKGSREALGLAQRLHLQGGKGPSLYSTVGVHPHDAKGAGEAALGELHSLLTANHLHKEGGRVVVAVGECGLDYNRNFSPPDVQRRVFATQAGWAKSLDLPLFCHEREAHDDFVSILRDAGVDMSRVCVHCFTGSAEELGRYIELGCYVGITGYINHNTRGKELRGFVKQLPLERLMVETDAPFMCPFQGVRTNEPSFLPAVVECLAECYGRTPLEVAQVTTQNAMSFFGITVTGC